VTIHAQFRLIFRIEQWLQSVKTATVWLQSRTKYRPKVAVICGSGLGSFADSIENADIFDYSTIPHFVACTGKFSAVSVTRKPRVLDVWCVAGGNMPDCGAWDPRNESHCGQFVCLSQAAPTAVH